MLSLRFEEWKELPGEDDNYSCDFRMAHVDEYLPPLTVKTGRLFMSRRVFNEKGYGKWFGSLRINEMPNLHITIENQESKEEAQSLVHTLFGAV